MSLRARALSVTRGPEAADEQHRVLLVGEAVRLVQGVHVPSVRGTGAESGPSKVLHSGSYSMRPRTECIEANAINALRIILDHSKHHDCIDL